MTRRATKLKNIQPHQNDEGKRDMNTYFFVGDLHDIV